MVEADLHTVYQVDVEDRDLLSRRSWRWLRIRILGLLNTPPTLTRVGGRVWVVPQTRIGYQLNPPGGE